MDLMNLIVQMQMETHIQKLLFRQDSMTPTVYGGYHIIVTSLKKMSVSKLILHSFLRALKACLHYRLLFIKIHLAMLCIMTSVHTCLHTYNVIFIFEIESKQVQISQGARDIPNSEEALGISIYRFKTQLKSK